MENRSLNTKISRIVPVYEVEKDIHKCIDSILAQTFTDFELILIVLVSTATVLSYDLAKDWYYAIDIGHIDIEYE